MTGMWLVCLSLLVAADAASIASKPVDIPVQVVYDDGVQLRQLDSLKNLEEKPQLSVEENVEAEVLHIPEVIAKIAQPVPDAEVKNEDSSSSSSSQSFESSEENVAVETSSENKSGEDIREQESNEVDSNNLENLKLKLVAPVEEIEVAEVAAVPIEEAVVLEADTPQVQEVVPEVQAVPEIQEVPAVPEVQDIVPVQFVQQENIEAIPVQDQNSNLLKQGNITTAPPNRPLLGLINRLGETVGNAINSFRPQNPTTPTAKPAVAAAETDPQATKVPLVSEGGLPIAAATAEEEPAAAPETSEAPAAPESPANPTFVGNLQQNINNQLTNFGNRVNTFINNLRPKQPEGSQSDEESVTPNTPVINNIQNTFNNGLAGFSNSVNSAFGLINQNQSNPAQADETSPQQPNPVQIFLNGASNFQQSFASFITGQNPNQQQSDEASPNNTANIGQQVLQVVTSGISNIVQNFRPGHNNATQSDEAAPGPAPGIFGIFGNWGQQINNLISGQGGIPTQLPGAGQIQNITSQFPGAGQIQNITSQFPGANQIQNLTSQFSGAGPLQNFTNQFTGGNQFPNITNLIPVGPNVPALPQFPLGGAIPELPAVAGIPSIPSIPGVPSSNSGSTSGAASPSDGSASSPAAAV